MKENALSQRHVEGFHANDKDIARLSPLGYEHLNFLGRYTFALPEVIEQGEYRRCAHQKKGVLERIEVRR